MLLLILNQKILITKNYLLDEQHQENETFTEDSFQQLRKIIADGVTIDSEIHVKISDILVTASKFKQKHNLNETATADIYKMLSILLKTESLPDTNYKIDKIFFSKSNVEFHAICPRCKRYAGTFNESDRFKECPVCQKNISLKSPTYYDFFVIFEIHNRIKNLIEKNLEHFLNVMKNIRSRNVENINDFMDGKLYKEFLDNLPSFIKLLATGIFNTDGSPAFESLNSKFSIWPIQISVNELPVYVRNLNPIVCGLWFGKSKPDMNIFLKPYVDLMNRYSSTGIKLNIHGVEKIIPFFVLCSCVDSGARYQMQGIVQYNGFHGCSWCLHEGKHIKNDEKLSRRGGSLKYTLTGTVPPLRTKENMLEHMQLSLTSTAPVFGVRNPSCLINMNGFQMPSGFTPDSLHLMGIAKQFIKYWIDSSKKKYSLTKEQIEIVDEYIKNLKVPKKVTKLTRSILERSHWTAREWENWVKYYSVPILLRFPHMLDYAIHWSKFVQAFYILNKDSIRPKELNQADELLKKFVCYTQFYYLESAMTYNVHQLLHLAQSVINWGPLWAHSGYVFENGNGLLKKKIHAARGVISQLCRTISMTYSESILYEKPDQLDPSLQSYVDHLDQKSNLRASAVKIKSECFFGSNTSVSSRWRMKLQLSQKSQCFTSMVKSKCLYESYDENLLRSDNSHAILEDGKFIRISKFIVDFDKNIAFVIYKTIHVQNIINTDLHIKKITDISLKKEYTKVDQIKKICVFMNENNSFYISSVPNLYNF